MSVVQGLKALRLRNWEPPPVAPVDAVRADAPTSTTVVTCCASSRQGFGGKVYCSRGTSDLCAILLPDSGHLQEEEARYANKRSFSLPQTECAFLINA